MPRPEIILASQSPQRKNLLTAAGISYTAHPANIDERSIRTSDLNQRAQDIAKAKAETVQKQYPQGVIIAADTFLVYQDQVFEKPTTPAEATKMLTAFSGQEIVTMTGVSILEPTGVLDRTTTIASRAQFRTLTLSEIEQYVTTQPVTTWAGGYSPAYDPGANLIEWVKGSLTGFTHGLPMEFVVPYLHAIMKQFD